MRAAQRDGSARAHAAGARRSEERDDGEEAEEQDSEGSLGGPVVHEPNLLGERQRQEVREAKYEEEEGQEGGRGRRDVEGGGLRLWKTKC